MHSRAVKSLAALLLATSLSSSPAWAQPTEGIEYAKELSGAFEHVANQITPSVVSVSSVKKARPMKQQADPGDMDPFKDFFDRFGGSPFQAPEGAPQQGLGTGVIVDDKGHILTNNHVIGEADEVTVRLQDDRQFKAEVVGTDPKTDLAVIRIKASNLVPAKLGNSSALKIGEWVVAAGNPFGLTNTITSGIVSAKGRSFMGGGQYEDFIQTDAAINPGNSGGPLVNLNGEVVGINTAIFSRSGGYMGIGFAIPIDMAKNVMNSLITKGKVVRGWLGVGIQNMTEELAQSFNYAGTEGALVGHIEPSGPADKSGLQQGDIITALNGDKVKNINQLRNAIAAMNPGTTAELDLLRSGRKETVSVKVGELPAQAGAPKKQEANGNDLGISAETLTPDLARRLGSSRNQGVIVMSVRPGSRADKAGLQPKDIIVKADNVPVKNLEDFYSTLDRANMKKGVLLVVETEGMQRFLKVTGDE